MVELIFRLAEKEEIDKLMTMYTDAIKEMNENGINQWDEIYPDRTILEDDIAKGQLYVGLFEDSIAAAYVLNQECDEEYRNGLWNYPDATYAVIHRLCVNPIFQNQKLGRQTMLHIERELKKREIESIRLDAFTGNPFALKLYEKLGYLKVGIVEWRKGEFYLMEKRI